MAKSTLLSKFLLVLCSGLLCTFLVVSLQPQDASEPTEQDQTAYTDEAQAEWFYQGEYEEAGPVDEQAQDVISDAPTYVLTQVEFDTLLSQLNNINNSLINIAQTILLSPNKPPNDELKTLLLNSNMPQNVTRSRETLIEGMDYADRLGDKLFEGLLYALPPSAEQNALEM